MCLLEKKKPKTKFVFPIFLLFENKKQIFKTVTKQLFVFSKTIFYITSYMKPNCPIFPIFLELNFFNGKCIPVNYILLEKKGKSGYQVINLKIIGLPSLKIGYS